MSETTVELKYPIQFGSEQINEIKIPRIKAKHLKGVDIKDFSKQDTLMKIIGNLGALTPAQVGELDWEDEMKIVEVLLDFLGGSQAIGKSVSE